MFDRLDVIAKKSVKKLLCKKNYKFLKFLWGLKGFEGTNEVKFFKRRLESANGHDLKIV